MALEPIIGFIDTYNLPWLLLALLTWVLILSFCSSRSFFHALPIGLWTMALGTCLESFFIHHKFWAERFILIPVGELDLFVILGPFFTIGILFIQFLPESRFGKCLSILVFSALATSIEWIAIQLEFLAYDPTKWGFPYSFAAYSLALLSAFGFYYLYYGNPKRPLF